MVSGHTLHRWLAIYFYEHKQLSIPHMGRFKLVGEMPIPSSHHLAGLLPEGCVEFTPNWNQQTDPELIDFITSQTHKMKALALADLESLSHQAQEMINIGQPYSFEGIATLSKDTHGNWELIPGRFIPEWSRAADTANSALHESPAVPQATSTLRVPFLMWNRRSWIILLLAVILAAGAVYFWRHRSKSAIPAAHTASSSTGISRSNTSGTSIRSLSPDQIRSSGTGFPDTLHYEVVFETAQFARAYRRYKQLSTWGAHVVLRTRDSITYTLATPFATPAIDSTHMKDSISRLYGRKVYIRIP